MNQYNNMDNLFKHQISLLDKNPKCCLISFTLLYNNPELRDDWVSTIRMVHDIEMSINGIVQQDYYYAIFFTEKIYKPIAMKHPFILVSRANSLKWLRNLGFKTFSPYIPEDYDSLTGLQRVDRIFEILDELIKSKRIETLLDDCSDILEHNHKLLVSEIEKHRTILKKRQFIK